MWVQPACVHHARRLLVCAPCASKRATSGTQVKIGRLSPKIGVISTPSELARPPLLFSSVLPHGVAPDHSFKGKLLPNFKMCHCDLGFLTVREEWLTGLREE
eukprot:3206724-Pleurochrysis_carterae.AAC.5